jgi:tetratricopeptide (TPR) repeat protein
VLTKFEKLFAAAEKRWPDKPLSPDLAAAYTAMGRGMISLGEIEQAMRYLRKSLAKRVTLGALEWLGTIELRRGNFRLAFAHLDRAIDMKAESVDDRFQRNKLLRLAAEAVAGAGNKTQAASILKEALAEWDRLTDDVDLNPPFLAEALVEIGKLLWQLGERETALATFDAAIDRDPGNDNIHADVVAFLVVRDQYDRALDTYHRALGSHEIGGYFKVYMSLWVVAEAQRSNRPIDRLAREFLASRNGSLWYDDLARFASGRAGAALLHKRATTRGRKAELLYYSAVLDQAASDPRAARKQLERVLDTDMLLFFEYRMAQHWLERGFAEESAGTEPNR